MNGNLASGCAIKRGKWMVVCSGCIDWFSNNRAWAVMNGIVVSGWDDNRWGTWRSQAQST